MNRRGKPWPGDREVQDGALGRGAVERIGRDVHLAHRIALLARRRALAVVHRAIVHARRPRQAGRSQRRCWARAVKPAFA